MSTLETRYRRNHRIKALDDNLTSPDTTTSTFAVCSRRLAYPFWQDCIECSLFCFFVFSSSPLYCLFTSFIVWVVAVVHFRLLVTRVCGVASPNEPTRPCVLNTISAMLFFPKDRRPLRRSP